MKMELAFVERIFPLYRKAVLDRIYREKKFIFFHTVDSRSGIRQTRADYSSIVKPFYYGKKESSLYLPLIAKLMRARPRLIVHEFSAGILSILPIMIFCRITGTRLVFWGHMFNRSQGFNPQQSRLDRYRKWLWKKADSLITYTKAEKQLLVDNGIDANKIFVAYNTVDTDTCLKARNELESEGRITVKERINFSHQFNLTFIGRLYADKMPDMLIDLLKILHERGFTSVAAHFVGDGEMLPVIKDKIKQSGLEKYAFCHGAIYDEHRIGEILFASDLMIMPGCVGLSVNHAFCFNCPVVTFGEVNGVPAHGPEIEYVIDGATGFIIRDHSLESLAEVVIRYLREDDLRYKMNKAVRKFIEEDCSVSAMAKGVLSAIHYNLREK